MIFCTCKQQFADKQNKAECSCVCHKTLPVLTNNGSGAWAWDFRKGEMANLKEVEADDAFVQTFIDAAKKFDVPIPNLEEVRV